MALRRFNRERVGQWRRNNLVSLGQICEPIVGIHARKDPVPDTGIFDEKVKPFFQTLAAVDEGLTVKDGMEDADAQGQCVFIVRDEGYIVTSSDFIVWGVRVFKVMGTKPWKGLTPFLEIVTAFYGNVSTCGFTLEPEMEVTQAGDADSLSATNPFWTD